MTTPLKARRTGAAITALGEFETGDALPIAHGGTGATDAAAARTALGLGTAATTDSTAYATADQGATADSAVQPGDLATVAISGSYDDLTDTPMLGTAATQDATAFDPAGSASGAISAHELAYDHALIATALQSETDPVFSAWDRSTGISITESQIRDFGDYEPADATILKTAAIGVTVCAQTDPRLSDARTPTAHKSSHATGQADAITPADIGAATAGHDHAGVYDPAGAASSAVSAHQSAYTHALIATAVQPDDLAAVATSGAYADLTGKPTLGTAAATDSTAYATAAQGAKADTALQPAVIDDTSVAANKLWSAQKISAELGDITSALDALNGEAV